MKWKRRTNWFRYDCVPKERERPHTISSFNNKRSGRVTAHCLNRTYFELIWNCINIPCFAFDFRANHFYQTDRPNSTTTNKLCSYFLFQCGVFDSNDLHFISVLVYYKYQIRPHPKNLNTILCFLACKMAKNRFIFSHFRLKIIRIHTAASKFIEIITILGDMNDNFNLMFFLFILWSSFVSRFRHINISFPKACNTTLITTTKMSKIWVCAHKSVCLFTWI